MPKRYLDLGRYRVEAVKAGVLFVWGPVEPTPNMPGIESRSLVGTIPGELTTSRIRLWLRVLRLRWQQWRASS
mgnify:CR=1 FL=1|jgi:hypothetical protein